MNSQVTTHASTHVVTGAGSGIGAAIARRLSDRGDQLILVARNEQRAVELRRDFPGAVTIQADLAQPETITAACVAAALPQQIDSVIHAAGVVELGRVAELPVAAWQQQFTVNVVAAAELTRHFLPQLRERAGQVLFINSGAGLRTHPEWSAYAASKHALKALADGLRAEESARGVRVTSVYPGRTATPMQAQVHEHERRPYEASEWIDPNSIATTVLTALDLPRDAHLVDVMVRPS